MRRDRFNFWAWAAGCVLGSGLCVLLCPATIGAAMLACAISLWIGATLELYFDGLRM